VNDLDQQCVESVRKVMLCFAGRAATKLDPWPSDVDAHINSLDTHTA
jgi:hypothetical protein